jgi:hypothetical protein
MQFYYIFLKNSVKFCSPAERGLATLSVAPPPSAGGWTMLEPVSKQKTS